MKVNAANGLARTLKPEGVPWVMEEERFAVADAFSRVTTGKHIGVRTILANLNAAGIQMAFGAMGQAWEDSSPLLGHHGRREPGRRTTHAFR